LKVRGDEQSVTNSGRLFHARGPATAKAKRAKSCTSVFVAIAGKFLLVPSDTFAEGWVSFSHKTHQKNESKKTRT